MGRITELRPDSATAQIAGVVPRSIVLPGNLVGRQREVLATPDFIGQGPGWDHRRVDIITARIRPPMAYLTRRLRAGTLWRASRGP
jgi:hypothetical protein